MSPPFSSYDETLAAWFYYDISTGETQWDHPLDDLYREKVEAARSSLQKSNNSETEQTNELPRDEVTLDKKDTLEIDQDKNVKNKLNIDIDENTEISVDTCEILEQSERAMMSLVRLTIHAGPD